MVDPLDRPVLVLNSGWDPIRVATVREAILLLVRHAARVVDPETQWPHLLDEWLEIPRNRTCEGVRSEQWLLALPEVVILGFHNGLSILFTGRNVLRRDRFTCQYCGAEPGPARVTINRIVPPSRGGAKTWTNWVASCEPCARRKENHLPEEVGMRLRRAPRAPSRRPALVIDPVFRPKSWEPYL